MPHWLLFLLIYDIAGFLLLFLYGLWDCFHVQEIVTLQNILEGAGMSLLFSILQTWPLVLGWVFFSDKINKIQKFYVNSDSIIIKGPKKSGDDKDTLFRESKRE